MTAQSIGLLRLPARLLAIDSLQAKEYPHVRCRTDVDASGAVVSRMQRNQRGEMYSRQHVIDRSGRTVGLLKPSDAGADANEGTRCAQHAFRRNTEAPAGERHRPRKLDAHRGEGYRKDGDSADKPARRSAAAWEKYAGSYGGIGKRRSRSKAQYDKQGYEYTKDHWLRKSP